ncbi:MAG: histidinol phosphatase, partial [Flavobacteriaceae bacterium CG17_big_fil_post_rev_8_21_14_2_50_33_15]
MLYIFKKKQFLKDLLENFVDIHCHILPGIDDGAKSIEESLLLIKKMQALGFKQCIATPHIMSDFYPNTEVTIGNAYQNLITELRKNKLNHIIINPAAEYMMDAHFETLVTQNNLFPLKENYVLVEMSYF